MSKENWLEKSMAAIMQIYSEEPNETNTILLGALLAITAHEEQQAINIPVAYEKPVRAIVARQMPKSLREFVEDELSDAELYYDMGEYEIAGDELRHADRFLSVLKAQGDKGDFNDLIARREAIAVKL